MLLFFVGLLIALVFNFFSSFGPKAELASLKDVEPLTGYVRGGVTVMGAKKPFPAFADETIELFDHISISAGQRGLQLILAPADYLRAAEATITDLTKGPASA